MNQPKKVGRPNLMESIGLTYTQVVEAVLRCKGDFKAAGLELKISSKSVRRYYNAVSGKKILSVHHKEREGKADQFIIDHPTPHSTRTLAKMSGISEATIRRAVHRRQTHLLDEVKQLGDFRCSSRRLYDIKGRLIWTNYISNYELEVDQWTLDIVIKAQLGTAGRAEFRVSPAVYKSWFTPPALGGKERELCTTIESETE